MGRPQFSTAGTGGGKSVATQNRPEIKSPGIRQTTTVEAGKREVTEIYAPDGATWNVLGLRMRCDAPESATAGSHIFLVRSANSQPIVLNGSSRYDSNLVFNENVFVQADNKQIPGTEAAQVAAVETLRATDQFPLRVRYGNNTDAAQSKDRAYDLVVEEVTF